MELEINGHVYKPKSGWAAIRNYCALHKPQVEFYEAFDHFKELNFDKPSNEMLDDFALLLWCFIDRGCKYANTDNDLTVDDVMDYIGEKKNIAPVIMLLYESYGVDVAKVDLSDKPNISDDEKEIKKNG